jgi:hypothetical protein
MEDLENLKSISWYLTSLSKRAGESELSNSEGFTKQALVAKESLEDLISLLVREQNDSPQTDKTIGERTK